MGSHFVELRQLAEESEVAAAGAFAEQEVVGGEQLGEDVEQALVGTLDDRLVLFGRADHRPPSDLAGGDELLGVLQLIAVGLQVA